MLLVVLGLVALAALYFGLIRPLGYWKRRGVPYSNGWRALFTMLTEKESFVDFTKTMYREFPNVR